MRLLRAQCDILLKDIEEVEIVSGTARGADCLGERYAKERGYPIKQFPANWSIGKHAGYLRNKQMAEYADVLIAFWDFKSPGTAHIIESLKKAGKPVEIVDYGGRGDLPSC